jgi:hypothetical protein
MTPIALELHRSPTDRAVLADSAVGLETVGMTGLLAARGRRAYRARVPGAASVGYRWGLRDTVSPTWWPQGIATGRHNGNPVIITSWFAQPRRGIKMGARISVIDLRDRARPRYHHVLLVEPKRRAGTVVFEPVEVHAGGIVWTGDRLLVAATHGGIREFHLGDILRTPTVGVLRRPTGLFGYRHILPQAAVHGPPDGQKRKGMRYSFLSLESGVDPVSAPLLSARGDSAGSVASAEPGQPAPPVRLITGEYAKDTGGRLGRMHLTEGRSTMHDLHVPNIVEMQGAVVHNGVWFVNASRGDKQGGDLWVGSPSRMTRHAGVLPPGPEDTAVSADDNQVWSVTEFPWKRWIYAIDLSHWQDAPGA